MTKNRRCCFFLVIALAIFLNGLIIAKNANALNFSGWSSKHITNQAYAQGVYRCYTAKNGQKGGPAFDNSASPAADADATQIAQTIHENTDTHTFGYKDLFQMTTAANAMFLPNGLTPVVGVNCAFLVNDWQAGVDISNEFDIPFSTTVYERLGVSRDKLDDVRKGGEKKAVDAFMTGMGYSSDEDTKTDTAFAACYVINYRADELTYEKGDDPQAAIQKVYNGEWNTQVDIPPVLEKSSDRAQICVTVGEDGKITKAESAGWVNGPYTGHGGEYLLAYADPYTSAVHFQIWAVVGDYGDYDNCIDYSTTCMDGIFDDPDNPDGSFDTIGLTLEDFKKKFKSVATQIRYTEGVGAVGSDKKYDTLAVAPRCLQSDGSPARCDDPDELWTGEAVGIYVFDIEELTGSAATNRTWTLTGDGNNALKYISDNSTLENKIKAGSSWSNAGISSSEKAILYQWYMANQTIGRVNIKCNPTAEELKLHPDWVYTVEWFNSEKEKLTCYVTDYNPEAMVVLADKDGYFNTFMSPITDLFAAMKYDFSTLINVDPNDIITVEEAQEAYANSLLSTGKEKENCYSGAGSLSWIVCPLIENASKLIIDKYVAWVEPALQINTLLFGNNDKSASYIAWNVFRNIANLAFVIIFIIVIFSQTTGVGIGHYGIKKILPKLIICALLINCSYIICQLAIDIANIIGYGIAGIFQWVTNQINITMSETIKVEGAIINPSEEEGLQGVLSNGNAGFGMVVVLIIGVVSTAAVLSQGTALVIPILMAVLGVAISFFTLIAILALRQAASVLLVVASPLAFVCYMLPNTKKIFDKWLKALQGLLIAFPACSALIYGGDLVGRVLISTSYGSTWILITAAVVSVAPIFFIPKIIRGSMGAISNAIANGSRKLSRTARDAGNNSRLAKEMRANHDWNWQRRMNMRRAGVKQDKKNGGYKRRLFGSGLYGIGVGRNEKIARARNAVLNDYAEMELGNRMVGENGVETLHNQMYAVQGKLNDAAIAATESRINQGQMTMTVRGKDGKDKEIKIDPSNIDQLKTALVQAILKGEDEKQKALTNILSSKGDKGREAVHGAIEETETAAQSMNESDIKKLMATHRSLASHIMDNFAGAYKDNNRSTYDWAANNQTEKEAFNRASLDEKKDMMRRNGLTGKSMTVGSVKPDTLINMDDQEFERLVRSTNDPNMKPEAKAKLSDAAIKALSSEAAAGAKIERVGQLRELIDKLGQAQGPKPLPSP